MVIPFYVSFDVSESEKVKVVVPLPVGFDVSASESEKVKVVVSLPVGFDVSAILVLERKPEETTIVGLCEVPVLERRLFAYEVH